VQAVPPAGRLTRHRADDDLAPLPTAQAKSPSCRPWARPLPVRTTQPTSPMSGAWSKSPIPRAG
jgi:hypothetical protein